MSASSDSCDRDRFDRRWFLAGSSTAVGAFFLPTLGSRLAVAKDTGQRGAARQAIVILLQGGCSHLDTWDLKPAAPVEMITTASGGHAMLLDDSSNVYSVATIGSDGKVKKICVDAPIKTDAALESAAKAAQENDNEK